jgi:Fungal chitosanase of glycosyl hydrolase group 75
MIPFDLVTRARRRQPSELQSAKQVELCVWDLPSTAIPALTALLTVCLCILLAGCPGPKFNPPPSVTPSPTPTPTFTPSPVPTPTPPPTPLPEAIIPYSRKDVARLFSGVEVHSQVESGLGDIASVERRALDSYVLDLQVHVRVPKAAQTIAELSEPDPSLPTILPGLAAMLPTSKVSDFYYGLYQLKVESLGRELGRLEQLLSKHNFFDCNTILELTNPQSARKVLLIQSDMDVNADGSDSDRTLDVDGSSANFQPYTSYRWPKRTDQPSEFLGDFQIKLKQAESELVLKTTSADRKKVLHEQIEALQREVGDLKHYSFLISKADPFVVLPGFILRQANHAFLPKLGDYVVVIYGEKLYPALLGDVGPSYKIGEGSLRLATQLDPRANAYNRPASNLNVTYLVFPATADPTPGPPDLKKMRDRCETLLSEIGGTSGQLWEWTDILAPPTPTPSPTPSTSPAPSATGSPAATGSASATGSPTPSATPSPSPTPTPSPTPAPPTPSPSAKPTKTSPHETPRRHHHEEGQTRGD